MENDTIAAIATALSDSGIGIIRVSGKEAIPFVDKIFRTPGGRKKLEKAASHTIHYGYIVDMEDECQTDWKNHIIDEVMVSVMKAPKSFTTEDTVEINCHGGVLVMRKILDFVCRSGCRLAEPGEFTKRAFLNGRIDLSKAEAVIDVINSKNEYALKSSMNQLQGKLSEKIRLLREKLLYEIAFIESALDDPEHISLEGYPEILFDKVVRIKNEIEKLILTADNGRLIKEGISTVILGKPNAGKSSLLNFLLGEDRAIVTDVAGTTRDALQESVRLGGITLNVVDTAGIRDTEDAVEKIGVERAKKYAADADLILYVVDSSVELDDNDREILSLIKDKKTIILLNKTDLKQLTGEDEVRSLMEEISKNKDFSILETTDIDEFAKGVILIHISVKEHMGLDILGQTIEKMFFNGLIKSDGEAVIVNLRHKNILQDAFHSLVLVQKSIKDGMPEDFYSIDLMSAYTSLGYIIGEEVEDDLVEEIFSKFCMGK